MTITSKEKKLLLIVFGLLILVACYFLVFTKKQSENETLKEQNSSLQSRIVQLQAKIANEEEEQAEIERMNAETQSVIYSFPAFIRSEDGILDIVSMEDNQKIEVTSVTISDAQMLELTSAEGTADNNASGTDSSDTSAASDTSNTTTDSSADASATDTAAGTDSNNNSTPGGVGTTGHYTVYGVNSSLSYTCDYTSLKELLGLFEDHSRRRSIQELMVTFDNSTGKLDGTMSYNSYFLFGSEKPYSEMVTELPLGTDNIFGTIELPEKDSDNKKSK